MRRPIPRSCLVSSFSLTTGLGQLARSLFDLGFFEEHTLFKVRKGDPEAGFTRVVRVPLNVAGSGALLSRFAPSQWSTFARTFDYIHFSSPHFFHLADRPRVATGTVADLFFLREYDDQQNPTTFRWYFRREMKFLDRLAGVVTISRVTDARLRTLRPDLRSTVIHPWTDDRFTPRDIGSARRRLGLPEDKVILLHVGAASRRKNLALLTKVLRRLDPNFLLVRVGPESPEDTRVSADRMRRFGSVSAEDYPFFFNAADVVLQPSRAEGFGVPLIEALNSGTPIVASDIGVFREILGPEYPYLAPVDDAERWEDRIREVVGHGRSRSVAPLASWRSYYRVERARQDFGRFFHRVGLT